MTKENGDHLFAFVIAKWLVLGTDDADPDDKQQNHNIRLPDDFSQ